MTLPTAFYEGCLGLLEDGSYTTKNVGDIACYLAARELLANKAKITLADVRRTDFYILGGGTIFRVCSTSTTPSLDKLDLPIFVCGAGVEPYGYPQHPPCQNFFDVLERSKLVGVRGPLSKEILDRYDEKSQVIGDIALQLRTDKPSIGRGSKTIALNIGDAGDYLFGSEHQLVEKSFDLVLKLQSIGYEIRKFAMWPKDLRVLRLLPGELMEFTNDPHEVIDWMKGCEFVVGEKLHAAILALCAETPFISLAYRHKCLDFMASLSDKLSGYYVKTDDPQLVVNVCAMVESLAEQYEAVKASMKEVRTHYVKRQELFVNEMMCLMREAPRND